MTVVYLVRHADPDRNTGLPYQTLPGPGLTGHGEHEARLLGRFLLWRVGDLWVSPMERTRMTAALIQAERVRAHGVEFNFCTEARLIESQPGEAIAAIRARMMEIFHAAALQSYNGGDHVALVTHGGPLAVLLEALGMPDAELIAHMAACDNGSPLPTAGALRCEHRADGWRFTLEFDPRRVEDRARLGVS